MKRTQTCWICLVLALAAAFGLNGCSKPEPPAAGGEPGSFGGDTPAETADTLFEQKGGDIALREWKSEALKVSFRYPEAYTLKVRPGDDEVVVLRGPGEHDITLKVLDTPRESDPAKFKETLGAAFDRMPESIRDFQEFDRKFLTLGDAPAAYIDYKCNLMKQDFRVMRLDVLKGGTQYSLLSVYLIKDDPWFQDSSKVVFNHFGTLPGIPDLTAVQEEKIEGTGGQLPTQPPDSTFPTGNSSGEATFQQKSIGTFTATEKPVGEKGAADAVQKAFGDSGRIADWNELKATYTSDFGDFFMNMKDGEAFWVTYNGEAFSGDRHYFIQRFDAGKPQGFAAHDSLGPLYLGSWYGIEMPVLVLKPAE